MTQSLARYHARSPRYFLNTEDDCLVRVAGPRQVPWEEGTEIRNVSLTGLAFTAPEDLCPLLGEVIRIQFSVPGGKQMACHAIVTRLEEDRDGVMQVGVHFYRLDMSHRIMLAQGLSRKFREQMARRGVLPERKSGMTLVLGTMTMMTALWGWALLTLMLVLQTPDGIFAALRGIFGSV